MARRPRVLPANSVVHVVNRGNERRRLFDRPSDYDDFLEILDRALERCPTRILAYALMPNHWHMVLWPDTARDLTRFLHYATALHAATMRRYTGTIGAGHVYQGRFRTTMVERDLHYWLTLRYVEANPLRAGFVREAADWPWTSLAERLGEPCRIVDGPLPMPPASVWRQLVNAAASSSSGAHGQPTTRQGRPALDCP